jgi:putative SOS response-associated peptidase YedK
MPVILSSGKRERWLEPDVHPDELSSLLQPDDGGEFKRYTVSPALNHVAKDSPELILPYEAQADLF